MTPTSALFVLVAGLIGGALLTWVLDDEQSPPARAITAFAMVEVLNLLYAPARLVSLQLAGRFDSMLAVFEGMAHWFVFSIGVAVSTYLVTRSKRK